MAGVYTSNPCEPKAQATLITTEFVFYMWSCIMSVREVSLTIVYLESTALSVSMYLLLTRGSQSEEFLKGKEAKSTSIRQRINGPHQALYTINKHYSQLRIRQS